MSGLRAGVIAAGEGSRLRGLSPGTLKPLAQVEGRPLIHWVLSGLRSAGAESALVLLNSRGGPVRDYLEREAPLPVSCIERDTASSWESFRLVARRLAEGSERFLLSTVDALLAPSDCARFAREAFAPFPDGTLPRAALGLTRHVDDEKPLWAELDAAGRVRALGPEARAGGLVTCGLYALAREAVSLFGGASEHAALRDFLAALARSGAPVRGVPLGPAVDVDRPEDLPAAEKLLRAASGIG